MSAATRFTLNYGYLARCILLLDLCPENSVSTFTVQFFTNPSISSHLSQQFHLPERIVEVLREFFMRETPEADLRRGYINWECEAFRNRRFIQRFPDLSSS